MLKRIITALVLITIVIGALILGRDTFNWLVRIILLLGGYEIYRIKKDDWPKYVLIYIYGVLLLSNLGLPISTIISFSLIICLTLCIVSDTIDFNDATFIFLMLTIIVLGLNAIDNILQLPIEVFLYIIIATYATDTFAYFGGSLFGKHKLIEKISPNKTVEGAVIGTLSSILISLLFAYFYIDLDIKVVIIGSLLMPLVAQIGDLAFSLIKRNFNIKDFGTLLPGHGGILDRIDSVLFTLIFFNAILTLFK